MAGAEWASWWTTGMGEVINFDNARVRRGLPARGQRQDLEARIFSLLAKLGNDPTVVAEIIRLRNEVWLLETGDEAPEPYPIF